VIYLKSGLIVTVRRKTAFEKFFSLNHQRKKWGAKQYISDTHNYHILKANILDCGTQKTVTSAEKSLPAHMDNLKREFSGQSELLFHHAKLIVLIRREISIQENYKLFRDVWDCESDFLLQNLDIRWLISAADTLADYDEDPMVRSVGMMCTLLANTVKLYETENRLHSNEDQRNSAENSLPPEIGSEALFGGLRCFAAGRDDTLRNMYWRMQSFATVRPSGKILSEIYDRLQKNDTAFSRFQKFNTSPRTAWWK